MKFATNWHMYDYFRLQQQILNRRLRALGIAPILGQGLALLLFVALSFYLFYKTTYAAYLYCVMALSLLAPLGEKERNEFLKVQFSKVDYRKIRALENGLIVLPFALFLGYKLQLVLAWLLIFLALLSSVINRNSRLNFTLPTPFYHFPFEYAQGFRQNWALYLLAYFITWKAIEVDNFNLGVGSLALLGILGLIHYGKAENEYFVWIYACSAKQLLYKKIGTACGYLTLSALPLLLVLGVFFADKIWILLGVQVLTSLFLLTLILAKYSAYPGAMSVPQVLLLGISLWFPPLLFLVIPMFYRRAVERLNLILT